MVVPRNHINLVLRWIASIIICNTHQTRNMTIRDRFHTLRRPSPHQYPREPAIRGQIHLNIPQHLGSHTVRLRLQCQPTILSQCLKTCSGIPHPSLTNGTPRLPSHHLLWHHQAVIRSPRRRAYPCCIRPPRISRHCKPRNRLRRCIHRVLHNLFSHSKHSITIVIKHSNNKINHRYPSNRLSMWRMHRFSSPPKIGNIA
jgi:hypothetical protein